MTAPRLPGELVAARLAVLPGGDVAEVIVTVRTAAYKERLRECYARWRSAAGWSGWWKVAGDVFDVSVAPLTGGGEPAALIGAVVWVPLPATAFATDHDSRGLAYYRLTASGVTPAGL